MMEAPIYAISVGGVILRALIAVVAGYFCGCFNGSVIVSKYILRNDIRGHGSGNAGLTNFYRVFGGSLTFAVILTDVLKAVIAMLIGSALFWFDPALGKYLTGTFVLIGHMFPCMFGFKGGKGILSGGTIAIMIDWRVALVVWGGFLLLFLLTKWVSLGSCWAAFSFPFATWFVFKNVWYLILSLVCGGLILWKHRENMGRILKGTESKFSFHHKKE